MHGFHGEYLRVDLTDGRSDRIPIPESVLRRFLGGVGLGAWLLHREAPPGVGPLAPAAPLIFAFSPLVGTPLTTSAKFAVVAKSPLTGMITDALSSSHFAIEGKKLGVDALVIVGSCSEPSVLVNESVVPTDLWGKSPSACEVAWKAGGRSAWIGTAGENLVRYATISNDGRQAGRGGLGAVMGAKKLKGVVVKGVVRTSLAEPTQVVSLARELSRRSLGPATAKYRELGTVSNLLSFNRLATLPTRNFQRSTFAGTAALCDELVAPARQKAKKSCACCTIGCERIYGFGNGKRARLEYENLFALGPLCGIDDLNAVLRASHRCDTLGLDTISAGGTISFAMECEERGLLDEGPRFGDADAVLTLLDDIAHRRGLGDLLAEGSRRAAKKIGGSSIEFAPQVKGLEIPGYEPRALQTMALGFAVGTRGADHNKSAAYELDFSAEVDRLRGDEEAARRALEPEDRAALLDSLILCKFLRGVFSDLFGEAATMLRATTGWPVTAAELRDTAKRIVALKKAFNIREGWTPEDDTLPRRFLAEELVDGASRGTRIPQERLRSMVRAYYLARGWTEHGYLTPKIYQDLGLTPGPHVVGP